MEKETTTFQILINIFTIFGTIIAIFSVISKEISKRKYKKEYINRLFWNRIYEKLNFEDIEWIDKNLEGSIGILYSKWVQRYYGFIDFLKTFDGEGLLVIKGKRKTKKVQLIFDELTKIDELIKKELSQNWNPNEIAYKVKNDNNNAYNIIILRKYFAKMYTKYNELFIILNY